MERARWFVFTVIAGCAADPTISTPDEDRFPDDVIATGVTEPPPPPPATCASAAPGAVMWRASLGAGGIGLTSSASILDGDVVITKALQQAVPTFGVERRRGGDGGEVWAWPFGALAAVGADGFVYVAAPFRQPFDAGFGTLEPAGGRDVFIAKLDAAGAPVFARSLRRSSDELLGLAVAADGRIAISGTGLGTVVLAGDATPRFEAPLAGDVAFDAGGDLVIAGAFAGAIDLGGGHAFCTDGDVDALIVKLDATGCVRWTVRLGDPPLPVMLGGSAGYAVTTRTRQAATAVAIDASGNVIVGGEAPEAADLLGDVIVSTVEASGLWPSGFVVKLTPDGGLVWSEHLHPVRAVADVAVDGAGNIFVSGAQVAIVAQSAISPMLVELSPAGGVLYSQGAANAGAGYALAVDGCGDVFQVVVERPLPTDWDAWLYKRAF